MSNIVIVGSGPAGVSAALYAVRAGVQTTVLTKGSGALARAEKIENYYGFAQPVSGPELERRSIENARRLGVQFVQTEAVGLTWTDRLTVETLMRPNASNVADVTFNSPCAHSCCAIKTKLGCSRSAQG